MPPAKQLDANIVTQYSAHFGPLQAQGLCISEAYVYTIF